MIAINIVQMYDLLFNKKGHIYICGDVKMADDVTNVLELGLQNESNISLDEAKIYINEMKENGRFHEDIFGNSMTIFGGECRYSSEVVQ